MAEFEVLQKLSFKVGEGAQSEGTQVARIHEKLIELMHFKGLFNQLGLSSQALSGFNTAI